MERPDGTTRITVYRESPEWDRHAKWFMLPMALLRSLFVCFYDVLDESFAKDLAHVESQHPDCVFVYVAP